MFQKRHLGLFFWGISPCFRVDSGRYFETHICDRLLIFIGYSPRDWEDEYIPTLLNLKEQIGCMVLEVGEKKGNWEKVKGGGNSVVHHPICFGAHIHERKDWQHQNWKRKQSHQGKKILRT